ncbi:unnamed protein product [Caenorhabditis angaria]|uniref:Uncharacterized protein n=1 Tax=Caenorhabditis angaria TaxID=860376 RepID=A0A9P1IB80_9PELO|nr:unnamed protein product [Caenorhabditis angaria]
MLALQQRPTTINEKAIYFPGDVIAPEPSIVANIGSVGGVEIAPRQWAVDHPSSQNKPERQPNVPVIIRQSPLISRLLAENRGLQKGTNN